MIDLEKFHLIGIGEFSHGIQESWEFRFKLLKDAIKTTKKKVIIFNEQSVWSAQNVMKSNGKFQIDEAGKSTKGYVFGKLWQYMNHLSESKIVLKIFKYIIKNRDRITLIGVDNDTLARDRNMFNIIKKNLNTGVNFFWAHNFHVGDHPMSADTYKWIKKTHPEEKWSAGHYLYDWLGAKYCIILSQAYSGVNRFNGYCRGANCSTRTWQLQYIYRKFINPAVKKYIHLLGKNKAVLLEPGEYNEKFIEFSNSYFEKNKYGYQRIHKSDKWNYVLFWDEVHELKPVFNYV